MGEAQDEFSYAMEGLTDVFRCLDAGLNDTSDKMQIIIDDDEPEQPQAYIKAAEQQITDELDFDRVHTWKSVSNTASDMKRDLEVSASRCTNDIRDAFHSAPAQLVIPRSQCQQQHQHRPASPDRTIFGTPASEPSHEIMTSVEQCSPQQKTEAAARCDRTNDFSKNIEKSRRYSDAQPRPRKRRCHKEAPSMSPYPVPTQSRIPEDQRGRPVSRSPMGSKAAGDFVMDLRRAQQLARRHQQEADNRAKLARNHAKCLSRVGKPAVKVSQAETLQEEQRNELKAAADEDSDPDVSDYVMVDVNDIE